MAIRIREITLEYRGGALLLYQVTEFDDTEVIAKDNPLPSKGSKGGMLHLSE